MAVTTGQVSVGTQRVQIAGSSANPYKVIIHNMSATQNLFLGNETVTATTGLEIHSHETLSLDVSPLDGLYVISASGTHDISWMKLT